MSWWACRCILRCACACLFAEMTTVRAHTGRTMMRMTHMHKMHTHMHEAMCAHTDVPTWASTQMHTAMSGDPCVRIPCSVIDHSNWSEAAPKSRATAHGWRAQAEKCIYWAISAVMIFINGHTRRACVSHLAARHAAWAWSETREGTPGIEPGTCWSAVSRSNHWAMCPSEWHCQRSMSRRKYTCVWM